MPRFGGIACSLLLAFMFMIAFDRFLLRTHVNTNAMGWLQQAPAPNAAHEPRHRSLDEFSGDCRCFLLRVGSGGCFVGVCRSG